MQLQAHQVIVSRVERRHEMRRDGDGNEEIFFIGSEVHFEHNSNDFLIIFPIKNQRMKYSLKIQELKCAKLNMCANS